MTLPTDTTETITIDTLLGFRFWDPVYDRPVSDGLDVVAWPESAPHAITPAFITRSGVYAFQNLTGLHSLEYPTDHGETSPPSPPAVHPFLVRVTDTQQRFMPFLLHVDLPLPYRGLYTSFTLDSPPGSSAPGFLLFSAPTRSPSAGIAVVRAQLVEAVSEKPAAYALLEIAIDGTAWYGLADARGCVAVLFPYPVFANTITGSPPRGEPLSTQTWSLTVRVRYQPSAQVVPPGQDLPRLRAIANQAQGTLRPTSIGPDLPQWPTDLAYGQELVLRTGALSTFWIRPGA